MKLCRHLLSPEECADCQRAVVAYSGHAEQVFIERVFQPVFEEYVEVHQGERPDPDVTGSTF